MSPSLSLPRLTATCLIAVLLTVSLPLPTQAAISACSASVNPSTLNPNQGATLTFSVTNNDGAAGAVWVKITRPSSDFTINGGSSSGWSRSVEPDTVTYTGGTLNASASHNFNVTVQTSITSASAQAWTVQVSDDSGGSSPTTCSGATSVTVSGDSTPPAISNIEAQNITAGTATITWTTDEASNSTVNYGLTTSYGQNATNSSTVTAHSVNLTGLTATTTYHFRVHSTDAASNTTTSSDQTFTTASQGNNSLTITNISATSIGTGSATITWNTNNTANSRVDYGATSSYGQSVTDSANTTDHSLNITNLTGSTTYHYKVTSSDQLGNTLSSGDNTFTTATASSGDGSSSGGGGGGSSGGGGNSSGSAPTASSPPSSGGSGTSSGGGGSSSGGGGSETTAPPAPDTQNPSITLSTSLSTPFSIAPTLSGIATDNISVQSVSYSLDGGSNWLGGVSLSGPATRRAFSVTPSASLADGNYNLRFRVFDTSGNLGLSPIYILIIDQLPPIVGPSLYTIGAQDIVLDNLDTSSVVAGLDQRITLSAVGGATNIDIVARSLDGSATEQTYSLVHNPDTGLWTGTISLEHNGRYELIARAVDGAGNRTERTLRQLEAVSGGQLLHDGDVVAGANVTIFHLDPISRQFELWDARPFNQTNPQTTTDEGQFKALLPPGTYYILATAAHLRPTQTPIFRLERNTPIQPVITMPTQPFWNLGPVRVAFPPRFLRHTVDLEIAPPVTITTSALLGQTLPATPIQKDGASLPLSAALGQRSLGTLITFLADWAPHTSEQLHQLEMLQQQFPGQVTAVMIQSSPNRTDLLRRRGRYTVPFLTDPLGQLTADLGLDTTPTHLVITPEGTIQAVTSGLKSTADLSGILTPITTP